MTFKYKIKIEIGCLTTEQLIFFFIFIVWEVQPLKIDFVMPWYILIEQEYLRPERQDGFWLPVLLILII